MKLTIDKTWLKTGKFFILPDELYLMEMTSSRVTYTLFGGKSESDVYDEVSFLTPSAYGLEVGWKEV